MLWDLLDLLFHLSCADYVSPVSHVSPAAKGFGVCGVLVFCLRVFGVCVVFVLFSVFCFLFLFCLLSSFADWCTAHRQQFREQKKLCFLLIPSHPAKVVPEIRTFFYLPRLAVECHFAIFAQRASDRGRLSVSARNAFVYILCTVSFWTTVLAPL